MRNILVIFVLLLLTCCNNSENKKFSELKKFDIFEDYLDYSLNFPNSKYQSEISDSLTKKIRNRKIYAVIVHYGLNEVTNQISYYNETFDQESSLDYRERNTLNIIMRSDGSIFYNSILIDSFDFKKTISEFLTNPYESEILSESEFISIPVFGKSKVSRGTIKIKPERKIKDFDHFYWNKIFESIFKINSIYQEFYNEISLDEFQKDYSRLSLDLKSAVCIRKSMYILIFFDEYF